MEAVMFIILQIFFAMRAVLKIGVYSWISPSLSWGIFGHVTCSDQSRKDLMDYKGGYMLQFLFCFLKGSPVHGSIQRGDTVLSLYGCQVNDKQDWNSCISKTLQSPQHGYCTDMLTITRKNSSKGDLKSLCNQSLGRHSDLLVSVLVSWLIGLGLSPLLGHCVVFLFGQDSLLSQCLPPLRSVNW